MPIFSGQLTAKTLDNFVPKWYSVKMVIKLPDGYYIIESALTMSSNLPSGKKKPTWYDWHGLDQPGWIDDYADVPELASEQAGCKHDWKVYKGFMHDDEYCTKCNIKKPVSK